MSEQTPEQRAAEVSEAIGNILLRTNPDTGATELADDPERIIAQAIRQARNEGAEWMREKIFEGELKSMGPAYTCYLRQKVYRLPHPE